MVMVRRAGGRAGRAKISGYGRLSSRVPFSALNGGQHVAGQLGEISNHGVNSLGRQVPHVLFRVHRIRIDLQAVFLAPSIKNPCNFNDFTAFDF